MVIFQNSGTLHGFQTECCNNDIKIHYYGVFQFMSEIKSAVNIA